MTSILHNRLFFARVRAAAYGRARERFAEVRVAFPAEGSPGKSFLQALDTLLSELETVREYAADALRGLDRGRLGRFREDRERGVLEEEIVLRHFCVEMEAQARFLRMRVETDLRIRVYRERMRRIRKTRFRDPDGRAHLPGILDSLGGLAERETGDFRRILEMMESRFDVGDRLMSVLREKLKVAAKPDQVEG